ncbi:MAG TPA: magnesium transporter CorA family protein [Rubrivivax sp.]|nr:magnesium transporter CorA family protein [Rubrivivax sp.]
MRCYHVAPEGFAELRGVPEALPPGGFLWASIERETLLHDHAGVQAALLRWTGATLVDLHLSDLVNAQLPSHFDDTSAYELMIVRRLAPAAARDDAAPLALETQALGMAVFDRVLLTVHAGDAAVHAHFVQRLSSQPEGPDLRGSARRPTSPSDLMLRMVNHVIDGYLDLRRLLSRQLGALQDELLDPRRRFHDWSRLLQVRNTLHAVEDLCEDQQAAVQEWLDALTEWPASADAAEQRERELLRVRTRDVLEHVERVLAHVQRLERSVENAVQMHFSALGQRTNDIMRTLTVLTAVFLPLNLITGFFGMNFDALPLIHSSLGIWVAVALMVAVFLAGLAFFWRKRYLGSAGR